MCELPSDQQNNRPAEHVRNWQFWDREGTAPDGGVRVVESLTRPTSFPWPQGDTSAAANESSRYRRRQYTRLLQAASGVGKALMPRIIADSKITPPLLHHHRGQTLAHPLRTNLPECDPKPDLSILLDRLGLTLPAQPPPKISGEAADTAKSTV